MKKLLSGLFALPLVAALLAGVSGTAQAESTWSR